MWEVDQVCEVEVVLANPLGVDVVIETLALSVEGVPFEAYPLAVTVPAMARAYTVVLAGKPLAVGAVCLRGCTIQVRFPGRPSSLGRGLLLMLLVLMALG